MYLRELFWGLCAGMLVRVQTRQSSPALFRVPPANNGDSKRHFFGLIGYSRWASADNDESSLSHQIPKSTFSADFLVVAISEVTASLCVCADMLVRVHTRQSSLLCLECLQPTMAIPISTLFKLIGYSRCASAEP